MNVSTPTLPPPRAEERTQRHLGLTVGLAVLGIFVTYVPITGVSIALTNIGQVTHASTSDDLDLRRCSTGSKNASKRTC